MDINDFSENTEGKRKKIKKKPNKKSEDKYLLLYKLRAKHEWGACKAGAKNRIMFRKTYKQKTKKITKSPKESEIWEVFQNMKEKSILHHNWLKCMCVVLI